MKKLSSYSKTKKIGCSCSICCILMIVSVVATFTIFTTLVQTDLISDVEIINEIGAPGKVFVAYRPGLSSFQQDITYAFVEGLEENDWQIEIATISTQTPLNISYYDLLIFESPTYGGKPQDSVVEYLGKLGNLNQTNVVIIVTSIASKEAIPIMEDLVVRANGKVIESLSFHTTDETAIDKSHQTALTYV